MKKIKHSIGAGFLLTLLLLTGCTSTTRISSEPSGASVYINGSYIGETPVTYKDSKISMSRSVITLKKEGFETFDTYLTKDEEADVGAIVGGIFFVFPYVWALGYHPEHHYFLDPVVYEKDYEQQSEYKLEQLSRLNEMYKEGLLTEEEFEILKKRIIAKKDR